MTSLRQDLEANLKLSHKLRSSVWACLFVFREDHARKDGQGGLAAGVSDWTGLPKSWDHYACPRPVLWKRALVLIVDILRAILSM